MLKLWSRTRPFQWYLDQLDCVDGVWIRHQNVLNLGKNLRGKFPLSTLCLSMASISCLLDSFLEVLELERSLLEGQQLQQKDRKKRKRESEKKKIKNENFDFCACLSKKVVKPASSEMKGRALCFEGHFGWFKAISANSRSQNVKNVLKIRVQRSSGQIAPGKWILLSG